nr:MAG TPA: hypothetical protein [Herelleviridae sp.]
MKIQFTVKIIIIPLCLVQNTVYLCIRLNVYNAQRNKKRRIKTITQEWNMKKKKGG